jgi:hypothetical protein
VELVINLQHIRPNTESVLLCSILMVCTLQMNADTIKVLFLMLIFMHFKQQIQYCFVIKYVRKSDVHICTDVCIGLQIIPADRAVVYIFRGILGYITNHS